MTLWLQSEKVEVGLGVDRNEKEGERKVGEGMHILLLSDSRREQKQGL